MKIELTQGCICDSFTADDKNVLDLTSEELKEILKRQTEKILNRQCEENDIYKYQTIIGTILEEFYDEYESGDEPCQCCGDWVETYTMEV